MIEGTLTFQTEVVEKVMSLYQKVDLTVGMDTVLNQEMLDRILTNGYSRIPVLKDGNPSLAIGILLAKSLIGVKGSANRTVLQLYKEKRI